MGEGAKSTSASNPSPSRWLDAEGVLAAQVDHEFTVESPWGQLRGKPGDFVVKNYADKDTAYPQDVWLVDRGFFMRLMRQQNG